MIVRGLEIRRPKIFELLPFAIIAILIISFSLAYLDSYEAKHQESVARELEAIASLKVDDLVQWRSERLGDGSLFFRNPSFSSSFSALLDNRSTEGALTGLAAWMKHVFSAYGYDRIFAFRSDGGVIAAYPLEGADDPVIAAAAPSAMDGAEVSFLDFYRNPMDGRIYLAVMVPVIDERGRGLLALRIDPERYLYPYLMRWPTASSSAETLLVRREGEEVIFLNRLRFDPDAALNRRARLDEGSKLPAARVAAGGKGLFEGFDYRGEAVVSFLCPIDDSPWFLVARMDQAEVDMDARERRFFMAFLVAAFLAADMAGFMAVSRRWKIEMMRKEADAGKAVRLSAERLELALDAAGQGLFDLNVQSGEAVVNDRYALMLGYDPAEFKETNQAWIERLHPEDRDAIAKAYADYVAGKTAEYRVEFRQKTKSGDWKWMLSLGKILERDGEGRPIRMLGTHTDIGLKKLYEQDLLNMNLDLERRVTERTAELEASNRELESFAYSVAHDLRAPLRSIDGFSRILNEEYGKTLDQEGMRLLDVIRSSVHKLDNLISDMLEVARIGRTDIRVERIDMRALAAEVFMTCADPSDLADFDFSVGDIPDASADRMMMERVWSNLLSNAVKYSMPSSTHRIEIGGYEKEGMKVYFVKDSGIGFDPHYAEKLFGMFQRLHASTEFSGSGVGLAIVRRIVERHGGKTWAEGTKGEGAVFYFSLKKETI